jgi:hypothetical protein
MKTFPEKVERWRKLVEETLKRLYFEFPNLKSSIDRFKPIFSDQVDVILALIQKESGGNEFAYGDSENPLIHTDDSIGLMQLNYEVGTPQGVGFKGSPEDLLNPVLNIYYGSKYFLKQIDRYDDLEKAILAYNAGSYILKAGIPINLDYLNSVLSYLTEKKTSLSSDSSQSDSLPTSDLENKKAIEIPNNGSSAGSLRTSKQIDEDRNEMDPSEGFVLDEFGRPVYKVHRKVYDYLIGSFIAVVLAIYFFTCN